MPVKIFKGFDQDEIKAHSTRILVKNAKIRHFSEIQTDRKKTTSKGKNRTQAALYADTRTRKHPFRTLFAPEYPAPGRTTIDIASPPKGTLAQETAPKNPG